MNIAVFWQGSSGTDVFVCSSGKGYTWVATWMTTGRESVPGLGDNRGVACLGVVTLTERLVTA